MDHEHSEDLRARIAELERQLEESRRICRQREALIACLPSVAWEAWGSPDVASHRVDYVSDNVEAMFSYTAQEWLSAPGFWRSLVHPEDREEIERWIAETSRSGGPAVQECRMVARDGRVVFVEIHARVIHDEAGAPVGMRGVILDVTRRKAAEQEKEILLALLESSLDFIGLSNLDGHAIYVNEAGQRMVGLQGIDQVRRTLILEYLSPEDRAYMQQHILPIVMTEGRWEGEFRLRHFQTGASIPIQLNVFVVKDRKTGQLVGMGTVTRDISERKRAEEERARLQEEVIRAQAAALRELSTPLIPISERVVVMPLIGVVDSMRAQQIMETLLRGIGERRSQIAILDITGVPVVDLQVASALMKVAQAVTLLGAPAIITGVRPEGAQTIVSLGIELQGITTLRTLQSGIAFAMKTERPRTSQVDAT
jgi:rsbT co-antagonist protein RsbR